MFRVSVAVSAPVVGNDSASVIGAAGVASARVSTGDSGVTGSDIVD